MKTMTRIILYTLVGYFSLSFISCNSLDLYPEDYYGSGNFWQKESQVEGYILGLHANLRDSHFLLYQLGEERGGTQKSGTSFVGTSLDDSSPIKTNQFTKDITGVTNWGGLYSNILNVNVLIKNLLDGGDFLTTNKKSYYLAQAYGIRAFYYFLLYRTYGGLPIIKDPKVTEGIEDVSSLYTERSSAKTTLDFIKEDINESETLFTSSGVTTTERCIWSKYATLMLKAEVYLWSSKVTLEDQNANTSDADIASRALDEILTKYELLDDFKDVFDYNNKDNNEIIFSLRFKDGESSNKVSYFLPARGVFVNLFYNRNGKVMGDTLQVRSTGLLRHEYKWDLYESMDDRDTRKSTTFLDCYFSDGSPAGVILRKFPGIVNSAGNKVYCDDYIVYRCADAILMKAEIENLKGGDVATYINKIRERAYGEKYDILNDTYSNASFAENELAILKERDKEFVYEGKRWFDVLRLQDDQKKPLVFSPLANYGVNLPLLNSSNAHTILWPIDVNTLNKDPLLVNNPGY